MSKPSAYHQATNFIELENLEFKIQYFVYVVSLLLSHPVITKTIILLVYI